VGSSHEKQGTKCQDANKVRELANGIVIAAVADGVGNCKYSDVASRIAVDVSTAFCEINLNIDSNNRDFADLIEEAFVQAELAIEKQSMQDSQPLPEYDTTLDLVIYDGKRATYGHCGDGGIIGLTNKGDYIKITTPQKKEGIFVIPLRDGSKNKNNTWIFGCVEDDLASVLLATDGVYDIFFPYLLKEQSIEVYVPLIKYFMDNTEIHVSKDKIEDIYEKRKAFLNSDTCKSITDDKTILVLINEDIMPERKEDAYYEEPNWEALQLEWNKKAYPHLYGKNEDTITERELAKKSGLTCRLAKKISGVFNNKSSGDR
jgi:serine/threonine protein phosphatase PrpC